jgi:hypothetical protein
MKHFSSLLVCGLALGGWLTAGNPARADDPPPRTKADPPKKGVVPPKDQADDQTGDVKAPEGIEVLSRGPLHEGFAQPARKNPRPGPVVSKKPPRAIKELPPDKKPAGKDVTWLPGYWSWDPERDDYIWVSGSWRVPPKGRRWLPGHWSQVNGGYRWVHGLWVAKGRTKMSYLAPPPKAIDNGPTSEKPDANSFWVPGNWEYRGGRYMWRPGYWETYRSDQVWNPAEYTWTPGGSVYNSGYWDYPLEDRGLCFAPVYFNDSWWDNGGGYYSPYWFLGHRHLLSALFFGSRWGWFFFGNWWGHHGWGRGFYPWYGWGRGGYNGLHGYYAWANRGNANWMRGMRSSYLAQRNGTAAGPRLVTPLNRAGAANVRLASVSRSQLAAQRTGIRQYNTLGRTLARQERIGARRGTLAAGSRSATRLASYRMPGSAANRAGTYRAPRTTFRSPGRGMGRTYNRRGLGTRYGTPRTNAGRVNPAYRAPVRTYGAPAYRSMPYRGGGFYRGGYGGYRGGFGGYRGGFGGGRGGFGGGRGGGRR